MNKVVLGAIVVSVLVLFVVWYNRPDNGIYSPNKNSVLISGEVITINWDATDAEADAALAMWRSKR